MKTELRVYHASFPSTSTMNMLKTLREWTGYLSNTGGNDKNLCNNSSVNSNSGVVLFQAQAGETHTQKPMYRREAF